MADIVYALIGYVVGVIFCLIVFRPMKEFGKGYDAAKELYSDWHKGFYTGWDCAFQAIKSIADAECNKYKQEVDDG